MIFEKNSIVEIENGLKFVVLDIKKYEDIEIALVQGLKDAVLRFALEKVDEKNRTARLVFVNDEKLIESIAKEFDRQDLEAKKNT